MEKFLVDVMTSHGYLAFILLAFLQAACIPISSEVTWAFAGVIAATHPDKFSVIGVIIAGVLAELAGSLASYGVGRRGGRSLLERYGKYVLVTHSDLDRAENFFANRGSWAVIVARALPVVRCFAGFAAGVVEIPAMAFAAFSFIGTLIWGIAVTMLGYNLGDTVTTLFNKFTVVGVVLVLVFLAALIAHRVHALRKERHAYAAAPSRDRRYDAREGRDYDAREGRDYDFGPDSDGRSGYNRDGYDRGGYDRGGYDQGGYDQGGYDRGGSDRDGGAGGRGGRRGSPPAKHRAPANRDQRR